MLFSLISVLISDHSIILHNLTIIKNYRNAPFYVVPKRIEDLLVQNRIVNNESNVYEFSNNQLNETNMSTLSNKKSNRLSEFLNSSRQLNSSASAAAASSRGNNYTQHSTPKLATLSSTNPFMDNRFPVIEPFNLKLIY